MPALQLVVMCKNTSFMLIFVRMVKVLYLTSVVPSVTRLVSMDTSGTPFIPPPLSVHRFTGVQSYGYTDQRKVEIDVEVTEDRTGDLSLRKPRTSQLGHMAWVCG